MSIKVLYDTHGHHCPSGIPKKTQKKGLADDLPFVRIALAIFTTHFLVSYFFPFAAPQGDFPPEYTPNWGALQFLVPMLRPPDPATGVDTSDKLFGIVRPGGGCNDLAISGHMVVAALTACAFHVSSTLLHLPPFPQGPNEGSEQEC